MFQDAGRVIRGSVALYPSSGSSQVLLEISQSMSLYRAGLELASFLPLGIALAASATVGFTDVSPVFTLPSRAKATQIDRTRVRKYSALGSTCLSGLFI